MEKPYPVGLCWLRRDLRARDNAALYHALRSCRQVHCVFVFDTAILDRLLHSCHVLNIRGRSYPALSRIEGVLNWNL